MHSVLSQKLITPLGRTSLDPRAILKHCGIRGGQHVADFGCGHGHFTLAASSLVGPRGKVFAVDIQSELLFAVQNEAAAHGHFNVHTIHADLEKFGSTKIVNHSVDMVLVANNHIDAHTLSKFFSEAVRVLKRGSTLVVLDWLPGNTVPYAPAIDDQVSRETAISLATGMGLHVIDEFRAGRYHYGVRFRTA